MSPPLTVPAIDVERLRNTHAEMCVAVNAIREFLAPPHDGPTSLGRVVVERLLKAWEEHAKMSAAAIHVLSTSAT